MIRIIMHGCNGKMGQVISDLVSKENGIEIIAGIDRHTEEKNGYPVFSSIRECDVSADVVIDFAVAGAVDDLLEYCTTKRLPLVLCTTGLSQSQLRRVNEASKKIPIVKSANMSLGINTLLTLLQKAAPILKESGFDIEIVEKHHNQKVDAPSGTALLLADTITEALESEPSYTYDRSQVQKKREENEIGILSVRGGTIVGEHEVIFAGTDEVITLKHTAYSKAIFAKGALQAAKFLVDKQAGLYTMQDII